MKRTISRIRYTMVAISIVFLFVSAFISLFWMSSNDDQIMTLQAEASKKQERIDALWQNIKAQENREDTLTILHALQSSNKQARKTFQNFAQKILVEINSENAEVTDFKTIIGTIEKNKTALAEKIDEIYISKSELENEIGRKNQSGRFYFALSFFLQIISVALVTISRDLRHE